MELLLIFILFCGLVLAYLFVSELFKMGHGSGGTLYALNRRQLYEEASFYRKLLFDFYIRNGYYPKEGENEYQLYIALEEIEKKLEQL